MRARDRRRVSDRNASRAGPGCGDHAARRPVDRDEHVRGGRAQRNKALGIWGALAASGATVGLVAGGLLTRYAGWQYIFYLNVPIGAAVLLLARRVVPESRLHGARRRYDPLGAITVTGALVVLVYAISQAPAVGWTAPRTLAMLAASAALLAGFLVVETRAEAPLLPLRLFRLKTLAGSNAVSFLLGASFFAFIFRYRMYARASPSTAPVAEIAATAGCGKPESAAAAFEFAVCVSSKIT